MTLAPDRLAPMANAIRALSMDAVQAANSGHPGMPMGMADVATVLFSKFLKFDPAAPQWPDRDRFVLSAGHGSMLLYSVLHLTGYASPTLDDIRAFRQLGSVCAGHPENFLIEGVECTTGPLGQGLAMAVGMAMAERHLNATFGDELVDHHTWVIAGDGCLMEGVNHEAIGLAGTLKLGRLKVLWDDNHITIDGDTALSTSEDIAARYRASGWDVFACDGHDFADIERALGEAAASDRPSLVACRTVIGQGAPNKAGSHDVHGSPLGADEIAAARKNLGWTAAPFEIPEDIADDWHLIGKRATAERREWEARLAASSHSAEFERRMAGQLPAGDDVAQAFEKWLAESATLATRKASENALNVLAPLVPELIGGSADLTGSNNTKAKCQQSFTPDNYAGSYVHYGIREFGMAAAMNGLALHGGVIPYGGTFLIFSDYCRNAIRLSALQHARVVYVLTHDSIGLGEDGPTHQPVEHVMSLRLIPNLNVFRPADVIETAECWQIALNARETPSVLALTRQNLPQLRNAGEMLSARGAYTLRAAEGTRTVILIATGSEVELAVKVRDALQAQGIGADVVSMPCMELFAQQDEAYQRDVLPNDPAILRVSIEAGVTHGWERYTAGSLGGGLNVGLDRFGASAPAPALFEKFGFTVEAIVPKILEKLNT
ncbi:transketolase [Novosphingobium sp. Leaf2]|uniref:transketolase n=1 Tax=Novosphingobium sp. Leaf2 TaxID=1735670 RepID=UPI0006F2074B|nr:transketolase [Novosphingobium sp. Leaf2]KQM13074.1 transketolase [Novosphingobium sp. Leaf2]